MFIFIDLTSACNFWLNSNAIRCLLGLSALCFRKLDTNETESCIRALLGIFFQYSPNFDWVVARLASCFPLRIISKLLQCGLSRFSANTNSTNDTEIKVLENLAFAHERDLKFAVKEMLQNVLKSGKDQQGIVNSIPYLLHICRMSNNVLQSIVSVFLELCK